MSPKSKRSSPPWRDERVAASPQNQALSVLLFLSREALHQNLGPVDALRAQKPRRLPTVLTRDEVQRLPGQMSGMHQLMARLLYGAGLRLMECLRLRVKDLDFDDCTVTVRDGKGGQDRVTILPDSLIASLREHLRQVKALHDRDLAQGYGAVSLPDALARTYPNAERAWGKNCSPTIGCPLAKPTRPTPVRGPLPTIRTPRPDGSLQG